jgi:hypothetical protein
VPDEAEAAVVVEIFERFAAGSSLRSIAAELRSRGVTGKNGAPFRAQVARQILRNRSYIGERTHHGKVVATATWPPIIDRRLFLAAQRILDEPGRRTQRDARARWLCSFLPGIVCDICGSPLVVNHRSGQRWYACYDGGHRRIKADSLDEHVTTAVLATLTDPRNYQRLVADTVDDAAADAARSAADAIRGELADLVGRGELSPRLIRRIQLRAVRRPPGPLAFTSG